MSYHHSEHRSKQAKRAILESLEELNKVRATELTQEVCDHALQRICSEFNLCVCRILVGLSKIIIFEMSETEEM